MTTPRSAPASPYHLNVLVVDDDDILADFVSMEIDALGCYSHCVTSGAEGLAYIGEHDVDMLITDWQMPGMDGMDLVRKVRANRRPDSHLHISMITANQDADAIRRALEVGVDDFLNKPIDPVKLELAVETARRNRRMHRLLKRRNELIATAHQRARDALARVQTDLDAAAALHEKMLPPTGRVGGVDVACVYRPALVLGGDTCGVSPLRDEGTLFFLIDVCGHGVPAALDSFHLHHRLKGMRPTTPQTLEEAVANLNNEICGRDDGSYATVLCGLLLPERGEGWIIRAGHPPPILVSNGSVTVLEEGGSMPLGWFDTTKFEATQISLEPGNRLLVYSDGLTECADSLGNFAGVELLIKMAETHRDQPVSNLAKDIDLAVRNIVGPRGPQDDVSLLILQVTNGVTE